ncbi:MAG: hypothetical protein LBI60_01590 [Bacteroidales bacterium]|jgi:hypothetical protein|nr:hypothetical protein [Bacteroidales bacterium]
MKRVIFISIIFFNAIKYGHAQNEDLSANYWKYLDVICGCTDAAIAKVEQRKKMQQQNNSSSSWSSFPGGGINFDVDEYNRCLENCRAQQRQQQQNSPQVTITVPSYKAAVIPETNTPPNWDGDVPVQQPQTTVTYGTGNLGRPSSTGTGSIIHKNNESAEKQMENIKALRENRAKYYAQLEEQRQERQRQIKERAEEYRAKMEHENAEITDALLNAVGRNKAYGNYLKIKNTADEISEKHVFNSGNSSLKNIAKQLNIVEYYLFNKRDSMEYILSHKDMEAIIIENKLDEKGYIYVIEGKVDNNKGVFYPLKSNDFNIYQEEIAIKEAEKLNQHEDKKWANSIKISGHIAEVNISDRFDFGSIYNNAHNAIKNAMDNSTLELTANYYPITYTAVPLELKQRQVQIEVPSDNPAVNANDLQLLYPDKQPKGTQIGKLLPVPDKHRFGSVVNQDEQSEKKDEEKNKDDESATDYGN